MSIRGIGMLFAGIVAGLSAGAQYLLPTFTLKDFSSYTTKNSITPFTIKTKQQQYMLPRQQTHAICPCVVGCAPLPVSLLSFEGERTSTEKVQLQWKTENEVMNKGFEVQRSLGNAYTFSEVAFVSAQAGSAVKKSYRIPDANDFAGTSYYRLKQLNTDGAYTYSNIIAVKGYDRTMTVTLFPNPAKNNLLVKLYFPNHGTGQLVVKNTLQQVQLIQKIEFTEGTTTLQIPVAHLGKGLYFVSVTANNGDTRNNKFIKL